MNRNQLKYLAILAMLIDHIAWAFVPTASLPGQLMHLVGRITAPTMAFFLAEGVHYTRSVRRYALRLGLFALLSWMPFVYFNSGTFSVTLSAGVLYALFLGLLGICLWDRTKLPVWAKALGVFMLCILSVPGDWSFFMVLWCLIFYRYRMFPKEKWAAYSMVSLSYCLPALSAGVWGLYSLGVFLPPLLLEYGYNGRPGAKGGFHKWFFYLFYPAHLLLLGVLRWAV